MTQSIRSDRRDFLVKSAALTGGLTLGVGFQALRSSYRATPEGPRSPIGSSSSPTTPC
jgi:hypothetical protein